MAVMPRAGDDAEGVGDKGRVAGRQCIPHQLSLRLGIVEILRAIERIVLSGSLLAPLAMMREP
jgi:hypothetical protein